VIPGSGVLVVDKPAGPTSFEVVKRVRRLAGARRAGHTGTLDPAATGVLAVCLEDAVKLQAWLTEGDKAYEATVAFGAETATEDAEGDVTARGDPAGLDRARIAAALPALTGELLQVPPMYSAVRVGGRRLHEVARAGEEVERAPRRVVVHALELVEVAPGPGPDGLLRARLAVRCGKGTYVRTLARDLGRALGVPAHLAALRRAAAGPFTLADAVGLEEAEALAREGRLAGKVLSPAEALRGWPRAELSAADAVELGHGRTVACPAGLAAGGRLVRGVGPGGELVAVLAERGGRLAPVRVLAPAGRPGPAGVDETREIP
jgi:tRNA pseudouridine55 synthase